MIFRIKRPYLACLIAGGSMVLAGCGGGGGSSRSGDVPPGNTSFSAEMGGVGSKGILRRAIVEASELDLNGATLRTVGSATTDDEGRYELTIGSAYDGGPILLELTADADTRMVCDVPAGCGDVAFGAEVALDEAFKLQSISPGVEAGSVIRAQLTPFTSMAARRALAAEQVTSEAVQRANSEVSQVLGVDVLSVEPVDLTDPANDSAESKVYAAYLAGVGAIAFKSAGKGVSALIEDLLAGFEDGVFDANDAVTVTELADSVQAVSASPALFPEGAPAAVTASIQRVKAAIREDGSYDPEPSEHADSPAVAQGKALLSQARTLGSSLADLEQPLDAFELEIETAQTALSKNAAALLEVVSRGFDAALEGVMEGEFPFDGSTQTRDLIDDEGFKVATIELSATENADGTTIAISELSLASGELVDLSMEFVTNLAMSDLTGGVAFDVSDVTFTASGTISNAESVLDLTGISLDVALVEPISVDPIDYGVGDFALKAASFSGALSATDVATGVVFSGEVGVELVGLDADVVALPGMEKSPASLRLVELAGSIEDGSGNAFDLGVSLELRNATEFDVLAFLDGEDSTETADHFANAVFTISANLALDGHPDTTATITLDRDKLDGGTAQLAFAEAGRSWSLSADVIDNDELSRLVISNPDAVVVTLERDASDEVAGDITVDGNEVAAIESDDGVVLVRWIDGTFETLY